MYAVESGADAQAAQAALQPWFVAVLLSGALPFAIGTVGFAVAIARSAILSPRVTWLVVAALIVMAASRFVALFAVKFYVQGAIALVALWPLAYQMSQHPTARPGGADATHTGDVMVADVSAGAADASGMRCRWRTRCRNPER